MSAPSIAEVLATPEGRRALSASSPTYFDTYYCGMRAADHRTRWLDTFDETIGEAHRSGQKGRLLLLAPRDHGKTETLISAAFRRVCLNRNIRILWISESAGTAKKRVGRLSKLLQSPRTKEDWEQSPEVGCGPFRQKDREGKLPKWTETQIYVTRTLDSVDPTIEAVGCGGGITGGHFDLIFCHERGTSMLHEGQWIPVEQHPSFQGFKRDDGFEVRLFGLPGAEVVTPEHRYWATRTPWFDNGGWVEARNLTRDHCLGQPNGSGGFTWSKVRSIEPVLNREFAPIKTPTSTYITAFGLSHNCDDLEDDRTTYSAAQRQKTRAWWRGTVIPMLARGGTFVVVGTRKHHDDLYSHLKESPAWRTIEDKAILKWPERHEVVVKWDKAKQQDVIDHVEIEGEAVVLWEAERDIRYLLKERYNMTSMVFAREFQHDVLDDSAAAYKMAWFEDAKARGALMRLGDIPVLDGRSLVISTGWDLALVDDAEKAQRQDSDFVAGMTVGRDPDTGDRYLLGIFHRRGMTPAAIQGAVKGQFEKFGGLGTGPDNPGVRAVVVERNAFGNLHYMGLQRSTDLPLKPHMTTGRNKADPWDGVASMGTQFENGKWIFPYHKEDKEGRALVDILVNELWGLGKEAHDDMAMALWIAELGLRGSTFVHRLAGADGVVEAGKGTEQQQVKVLVSKVPPPDFQAKQLWGSLSGLLGGQGSVYDAEYTDFEDISE